MKQLKEDTSINTSSVGDFKVFKKGECGGKPKNIQRRKMKNKNLIDKIGATVNEAPDNKKLLKAEKMGKQMLKTGSSYVCIYLNDGEYIITDFEMKNPEKSGAKLIKVLKK